jgi:hypothetical protein
MQIRDKILVRGVDDGIAATSMPWARPNGTRRTEPWSSGNLVVSLSRRLQYAAYINDHTPQLGSEIMPLASSNHKAHSSLGSQASFGGRDGARR